MTVRPTSATTGRPTALPAAWSSSPTGWERPDSQPRQPEPMCPGLSPDRPGSRSVTSGSLRARRALTQLDRRGAWPARPRRDRVAPRRQFELQGLDRAPTTHVARCQDRLVPRWRPAPTRPRLSTAGRPCRTTCFYGGRRWHESVRRGGRERHPASLASPSPPTRPRHVRSRRHRPQVAQEQLSEFVRSRPQRPEPARSDLSTGDRVSLSKPRDCSRRPVEQSSPDPPPEWPTPRFVSPGSRRPRVDRTPAYTALGSRYPGTTPSRVPQSWTDRQGTRYSVRK